MSNVTLESVGPKYYVHSAQGVCLARWCSRLGEVYETPAEFVRSETPEDWLARCLRRWPDLPTTLPPLESVQ